MAWKEYCLTFIEKCKANYRRMIGKDLNLSSPKTFTEKMQWLKIYDSTFLKTFCTDKITLHNYCEAKLGKDICIPLLGTYRTPDEIDFAKLPNAFVIKCNHGCKMNILVQDKSQLNVSQVKQRLNRWLLQDFSNVNGCELHYRPIPHKILIEEYKENSGCADLTDFKFYCFNGKPLFCQVITDRHSKMMLSHYDMNWTYAPQYDRKEYSSVNNIPKPKTFDEMLKYSEILSADFKFCRCDFYEIDGKVFLGELTFTPNSGYHHFKDDNTDLFLGEQLKL